MAAIPSPSPRYIVMSASAHMPNSCWGRYARYAVVELEEGFEGLPKMISERARGVARIVRTWERCNMGQMIRSAAARALAEAESLADALNAAAAQAQFEDLAAFVVAA